MVGAVANAACGRCSEQQAGAAVEICRTIVRWQISGTANGSCVAARPQGMRRFSFKYITYRGVAQFGRALRSGRRGRRFKSCRLDQNRKSVHESGRIFDFVLFIFHYSIFIIHLLVKRQQYFTSAWQHISLHSLENVVIMYLRTFTPAFFLLVKKKRGVINGLHCKGEIYK